MFDIEFDPELGIWSPLVYWYVIVNAFICAAFTVVVVIGGIFDLRFLFRALREEVADETDDGRVVQAHGKAEQHSEAI
ncbi:hypothetical protein OAS39_05295 [Pirellulales bacterium]|nr:hypothetical protein [Pirellulales bacterium]